MPYPKKKKKPAKKPRKSSLKSIFDRPYRSVKGTTDPLSRIQP